MQTKTIAGLLQFAAKSYMLESCSQRVSMLKRAVCMGALCFAFVGASLQAGTLVLGDPPTPGTGDCDPFGCPGFFGLGTYQQVYSSTAFPSTITIDSLAFFQTQVVNNGGEPAGGTYTLSFAYTSAGPGDLNLTDPGQNIGSGSEDFFTGTLPALTADGAGNLLGFTGTPFTYNPADGNLLLTVAVTGATNTQPYLYLDAAQCGPQTVCQMGSTPVSGDAYYGYVNGGNVDGGLVTGFAYTATTGLPTPEPASLLLVLAGIGPIGYYGHRRLAASRRS
jgi:hypothetical protein